jgi:hypothetical protein
LPLSRWKRAKISAGRYEPVRLPTWICEFAYGQATDTSMYSDIGNLQVVAHDERAALSRTALG